MSASYMCSAAASDEPAQHALLARARAGEREALGQMLETCRTYLTHVARNELDRALQGKVNPSDLVQETFVVAQQVVGRFRGESPDAMLAWLHGILLNKINEARKRYLKTQGRAVGREVPLGSRSHAALGSDTPSRQMMALENDERVSLALAELSEDHRRVIQLRNWEVLPFEEIGARMGRTAGAARALWLRAISSLSDALDEDR